MNRKKLSGNGSAGCIMPLTIAFLAFLLFVASLYLFPQFKASMGLGNLPTSFDEMRADQVMGYKTTQIQEAVLMDTRDKSEFIVLNQDIKIDIQISQMLWNIPIFEKTQVIHAFGTGAYGLDLSDIASGSMEVNHNLRVVTITLDHASLLYIEPDYMKTQYEDTQHALLAFGDIKMTQEQQTVVNQEIKDAMKDALNTQELLSRADEESKEKVEKLLEPLIHGIVPTYSIVIQNISDAKP